MSTDLKTSNNYLTNLTNTISSGATTITVDDASGLPDLPDVNSFTYITLISKTDSSQEILKVTDITGNVLTVERAQDGTVGLPFDAGDEVRNFYVSAMFQYLASLTSGSNPGLTKYLTVTTIAGTSYTVQDSDSASILYCTSDSPVELTFETGYTAGHQLGIMQGGLGQVTCTAGAGVTFSDVGQVATIEQGSLLSCVMYTTDSFNFVGEQVGAPIIGSIETASRTINIPASAQVDGNPFDTWAAIQDLWNTVGGYIEQGVVIKIVFEDGTYDIGGNILRVPDFAGGGRLEIGASTITGPNVAASSKAVVIKGTGSNAYSNIQPYNTTLEDQRYLVMSIGANIVQFGDMGFILQEEAGLTYQRNSTIFAATTQVSVQDCGVDNEVTKGNTSACVLASNEATLNNNGNEFNVVIGHSEGIAACVACVGGGTNGIAYNLTGTGDYGYFAANTGQIAVGGNGIVASISDGLTQLGTILTNDF